MWAALQLSYGVRRLRLLRRCGAPAPPRPISMHPVAQMRLVAFRLGTRRLLRTSALAVVGAGCSGADAPTQPARSLTGVWAGSSALFALSLDLRSAGGTVSGRGWWAQVLYEVDGTRYALNPTVAVPVTVSGVTRDSTFVLTLTSAPAAGQVGSSRLESVVVRGTAREGVLDVRFAATASASSPPVEQAALLTPDADSVARGRLTLRGARPWGGAPVVDLVQVGSAWEGPALFSYAREPAFGLGSFGSDSTGVLLELASGRPAVGRYELGRAKAWVPPACGRRSCPDYEPTAAAPGELVITRSSARAVSGTFRFIGVRTPQFAPPDTLVFEGAFDLACASRGC